MTGEERTIAKVLVDEAVRVKAGIRARPRSTTISRRCEGSTYTGDRCMNATVDDSGYCYAHLTEARA